MINYEDNEIYIVFIINNHYVRWEIFSLTTDMKEVYLLLKHKYGINKCILEVNDFIIANYNNDYLLTLIQRQNTNTFYVTTAKNYKLDKSIF
tara:strand:- start:59 stop:334 length:276 start_codon:yes stop_codon:yes gene_type:complete